MRTIKLAGVFGALLVLVSGCSESKTCKPETVFATVSCPAGFSGGVFEVSLSRDGGDFTKLPRDLKANCPQTTVEVNLKDYSSLKRVAVQVVAVDADGKRFPITRADVEVGSTCTTIPADSFGEVDAGEAMMRPDGGGSEGDGGADSMSESCTSNDKRCFEGNSQVCTDSVWVKDKDCANLCVDGLCTGQCKPGTKSCTAKTPMTCGTDGNPSSGAPCPNLCAGGECVGDCAPRDRRCSTTATNTPELCDEAGKWKPEAACTTSCQDGFCSGCTKGDTMCNGDTPYTCNAAGKWDKGADCPYFCNAATRKCGGNCKPGSVRCGAGEKIDTCDATGEWKPADTACPYVCKAPGSCGGACKPGDAVCGAGNTAKICGADGAWSEGTKCSFVCTAGKCGGSCFPGDVQCNPAGGALQTCSADGAWADTMTCGSGCRMKACSACVPGRSQCTGTNNSDSQTCDTNGNWGTAMACTTGCSSGACNECSGGPKCTADGSGFQACVSGAWGAATSCAGKGCLGGKCNLCSPDAKRCAGGIAYTCKSDGTGETQKDCGVPGCNAAATDCNVCKPGKRCSTDLKTAYECNASGTVEVSASCGAETCNTDPARLVCNTCKPNDVTCTGTNKMVCDSLGSKWTVLETCAKGCSNNTCNLCGASDRRCTSSTAPYGNLEACSADLKSWAPLQSCPAPGGCNPGKLSCNSCLPTAKRCSSVSQQAICRADGSVEDFMNCGSGKYCSNEDCVSCAAPPAACTGTGNFCSGTTVVTCGPGANGCLVQTGTNSCPTRQLCSSGACACPAPVAPCTKAGDTCNAANNAKVTCGQENGCFYQISTSSCAAPPGGNGTGVCSGNGVCTPTCNNGFTLCGDGTCKTECPGIKWFDASLGCPLGVSDDGQVVLFPGANRWQRATGNVVSLSVPGLQAGTVEVLAGDGTAVGTGTSGTDPQFGIYKWPVSGVALGVPNTSGFIPVAASQNASYVLASVINTSGDIVRIGPTGIVDVTSYAIAEDISSAGDFAVGYNVVQKKAFFWSPSTLIDLPTSHGLATSDTGRTFVGYDATNRVFGFTDNGRNETTFYGTISPFCDQPYSKHSLDISGDGTKILGVVSPSLTECDAAIVSSNGSTKKVAALLSEASIPINGGFRLDTGSGISRNGLVVIGCGTLNGDKQNPMGYRVVLP